MQVSDSNTEATISKLSAIHRGYFQDPFAAEFVQSNQKKDVIINRGYWCRVQIFNELIQKFLSQYKEQKVQIISIGAGYDTNYWSLQSNQDYYDKFNFIELDLEEVVKKKISKIKSSTVLRSILKQAQINENYIQSQNYQITPCDLEKKNEFENTMIKLQLDKNLPTFVYSECVLIYVQESSLNELHACIQNYFQKVFYMDYEMFNPNDRFGTMMVKNFGKMGMPLKSIKDNLEQIHQSFDNFYSNTEIHTMLNIFNNKVNQEERKRILKIEMMDEFEEWNMMLEHYYISISSKGTDPIKI